MRFFSSLAGLLGRGDRDVLSIPAMDGVFKPNARLDAAEAILGLPGVDNLAAGPHALYCSSADTVFRVEPKAGRAEPVRAFDGAVTMIATSPAGRLAVGIEGTGVELFDGVDWRRFDLPAGCASCITAGLFGGEDELCLAIGSRAHTASDWKRDLMNRRSTGVVIRSRLSTGAHQIIADGLAFPYGLATLADGKLAVSEGWRHRVLSLPARAGSAAGVLIGDLPAYPARLSPASDGGFWLALFAPRRQLTEFVLVEDDYRREMMARIPPQAWIGPDFADGDEEQPLQAGSVRQMGIMKPWAPSRSYGLVARLDREMQPVATFHSRADGRRHGIASVVEFEGHLYAASRGSGALLRIGDLT